MSKKEAILERSTQIFLETGLNKISMDELAEKIAISKKTIYNNYGSKDNLIKAIIESKVSNLLSNVKKTLASNEISIIEKVEKSFKQIYDFHIIFENPINKDPAFSMVMNSPICIALDTEITESIHKIAIEAKEKGYLREGINIDMFPYIFTNIINSTASWIRPDSVTFSKMELMRNTIQFILDGIMSPEAQKLFPKLNS